MKNVVLLLAALSLLIAFGGCSEENSGVEILPRESKIPADAVKVTPQKDIYPPQLHSNEWNQPIPLPGPINTAGAEDSPFVTPDGNTFYFFFTPDPNVPPEKQLFDGVTGPYVTTKQGGAWVKPERVILNDDVSLDGCQCVQGDVLWFCSARAGNYREIDMYTAEMKDGEWTNWENAGHRLNEVIEIGEMHITADGNTIYFDADRAGSKGGHDIWVIEKINGEWQMPENVEAVNTSENEIRPFLTSDGNELWFSRQYKGSPAVYRSIKSGDEWQEAELIISQFAAEPSLDDEGNIYFAHHFFEDGKMIEADIYVAMKK